jgi:3-oxoacyl-[acyl-carrier-protein] synthase II
MRRVVVTGMGAISPLGNDVESSWRMAVNGCSGIGTITRFDASPYETRIAGEVKDFRVEEYITAKSARRMDRFIHYAIAVCKQAVRQSGLQVREDNADDIGVIIGSAIGGVETLTEAVRTIDREGPYKISPFTVLMVLTDLAAGHVAIEVGIRGPNYAIVSACSSSAHAIGEAVEMIRRGDAKAMLAGGAEATVCSVGLSVFGVMRALSTRNDDPQKASRPFDKLRDGFVLSEGAAVLLLEDLEFARARGADILAEIVGYGASADAFHVTAPADDGSGIARAMTLALRKAGLEPQDIDYINAHGTSTLLNDRTETLAIKKVFGEYAGKIPISSTKSMTGHMVGATGALEMIFCVKAIQEGVVPPTINQEVPDPECDLDTVPNEARQVNVRRALSNSMGFGGHNAALIVQQVEEDL